MQNNFMKEAINLASEGMRLSQGGPFGAVVVKDNIIIGKGYNKVLGANDPTAHAEVTAIREACEKLNSYWLLGCEIYTSCEPCPMCLGAIYWARIEKIYYGATRKDAAEIGFDDNFFYEELAKKINDRNIKMISCLREEAIIPFNQWGEMQGKVKY
jgi:guanine deaminase